MVNNASVIAQRKKEGRGIIITIFLIIASCVALYTTYTSATNSVTHLNDVQTYETFGLRLLILTGILLMWNWKKFGAYLYYISILLFLFLPAIFPQRNGLATPTGSDYGILISMAVVIYAILYFLFKPKWHLFV